MTSTRQGFLKHVRMPPALFRRGINLWPPFLGAGIKVTRVSADYRAIDVSLKLGLFNRNYFGTQFGGSLFAMTDPFFALMMLQSLGPDYVVWDRAGAIEYLKPGRGHVHASFRLDERDVDAARSATRGGGRHEPTFHVDIVDGAGEVVARVSKTLYVRRRPEAGDADSDAPAAKPRRVARRTPRATASRPAGRRHA